MMTSDELYGQLRKDHFIFAGPCALESFELALDTAHAVAEASKEAGLFAVFNSSWDKANRTSGKGFRGPGLVKGMEWLARIKEETGLPVVTDIHLPEQAGPVGEVADILQIPVEAVAVQDHVCEPGAALTEIYEVYLAEESGSI